MEYLPEIAQLCVTAVNIVFILVFCFIDTGTSKHPKKKNMIAGISLLAVDFVFDVICLVYFLANGKAESGVVFVLYFPLIWYFAYETIKELNAVPKE